jgi:hypothetical protein
VSSHQFPVDWDGEKNRKGKNLWQFLRQDGRSISGAQLELPVDVNLRAFLFDNGHWTILALELGA